MSVELEPKFQAQPSENFWFQPDPKLLAL